MTKAKHKSVGSRGLGDLLGGGEPEPIAGASSIQEEQPNREDSATVIQPRRV